MNPITEKIKTVQDALDYNGVKREDVIPYANPVKSPDEDSYSDQECINAFAEMIQVTRALNEKKNPDWNDTDEPKWFPRFFMRDKPGFGVSTTGYDFWCATTTAASRLSFREEEVSDYAGKQFESTYKVLMSK